MSVAKLVATSLAAASAIDLTWSDCGDASTVGTVTDVQPTTLDLGKNTLKGKGTLTKDEDGGTFKFTAKAGPIPVLSGSGDLCQDSTINLPLGAGSVVFKSVGCPVKAGDIELDIDINILSEEVTNDLVKIAVTAESTSGDNLLCLNLGVASAAAPQQPSFEDWASQYGVNAADEEIRAKYEANVVEIDALNAAEDGATYAVNQFSGMSWDEFEAEQLTATEDPDFGDAPFLGVEALKELDSASVDWDVTPVKDQGHCGSCWAFGTMGAIEAIHKQQTGKEVILSEQQLVDCSTANNGCKGGSQESAMSYLATGAIYTSDSYPYEGEDGTCHKGTPSGVTIAGYTHTEKSDEGLASGLAESAFTVSIKVDSKFQHYSSGVLTGADTPCSHNHAVTLTGTDGQYWKIKNSWGANWGENGYIRFARSTAGCGPFGIFTKGGVIPKSVTEVQV